jgi:hypothetical protein
MKHTSIAKHLLAATLLTFGSLTGGAHAALSLVITQDLIAAKTTVTLTGTDFTVAGLSRTLFNRIGSSSTYMSPSAGVVTFSGPTDTFFDAATTIYTIPTYNYGTGSNDTEASQLSPSNPFLVMGAGIFGLFPGHESDDISNFVATATYAGTFASKGIDPTPKTITFFNRQVLSISFQSVPETSSALLCGLASLGIVLRRRRHN